MFGKRLINAGGVACTTDTPQIVPDCIAYYKLDGNAEDVLLTNDGTLLGTGSFSSEGRFGGSYENNNTSGISYGSFGISGSSATFSGSMWLKFDALSTDQNFIMLTGSDTAGSTYVLGINTSGNFLIDAYGLAYFFNNTTTINPSIWYHIVGVSNGSNHKLYINGVLDGEINQSLSFVDNFRVIGGRSIDNSTIYPDALRGSIDQVRIFDRTITAEEVTTLYNEVQCP